MSEIDKRNILSKVALGSLPPDTIITNGILFDVSMRNRSQGSRDEIGNLAEAILRMQDSLRLAIERSGSGNRMGLPSKHILGTAVSSAGQGQDESWYHPAVGSKPSVCQKYRDRIFPEALSPSLSIWRGQLPDARSGGAERSN